MLQFRFNGFVDDEMDDGLRYPVVGGGDALVEAQNTLQYKRFSKLCKQLIFLSNLIF